MGFFGSITNFFYQGWLDIEPFVCNAADYILSPLILGIFIIIFFSILHINVADTSMTIATKMGAHKKYNQNIPLILIRIFIQAVVVSVLVLVSIAFTFGFSEISKQDYVILKAYIADDYEEKYQQNNNYLNDYVLFPLTDQKHKDTMKVFITRYFKGDKSLNYSELRCFSMKSKRLRIKEKHREYELSKKD